MSRVLVTDGDERAALAVVRSLGLAGHRVEVAGAGRSLAGASRYARAEHRLADPLSDPEGFFDGVAHLVASGVELIIPITDAALLALLPRREALAPARIPFADVGVITTAADKLRVAELAGEAGISVPSQATVAHGETPGRLPPFPLVLKPHRSVVGHPGGRRKLSVRLVGGREELDAALADLPAEAFPVMLQQRITGPGTGLFFLIWNGEPRATFAHCRLREKPPSGGVSVYRESIAAAPALVDKCLVLLGRLGWQGVCMVELKLDQATGTPYLMEINGRFWGSLQLAIDAGVDFPRMLVDLALDRDPGPAPEWKTGVRSRWEWGEVDHLIAAWRNGSRGRLRALADLLRIRGADRLEVLRLSDPRPFLRESAGWFRALRVAR